MFLVFLSPCRSGNILESLHHLLQLIHLCVQIISTLLVLIVVHSADSIDRLGRFPFHFLELIMVFFFFFDKLQMLVCSLTRQYISKFIHWIVHIQITAFPTWWLLRSKRNTKILYWEQKYVVRPNNLCQRKKTLYLCYMLKSYVTILAFIRN